MAWREITKNGSSNALRIHGAGIFTYIGIILPTVHVDKYSIHGSSGMGFFIAPNGRFSNAIFDYRRIILIVLGGLYNYS